MADQPSFIPSAWAANNSTTETIPATTSESGKASWDQGFPVETSLPLTEGGIPPKYGDFNGILNVLSQFCVFAQAGGQFTWSSTLSYSVGSIVVGSDGSIYRAVQATTNVNPVGDTSGKWERIVSQSDIAAMETDIQTAMTNASDAVSNASAAQSAVSTLDANVVKLSGNQTVGGVKTFSGPLVITDDSICIRRSNKTGGLRLTGGNSTSASDGGFLTLFGAEDAQCPGYFRIYASIGAETRTLLEGRPSGTLTWGGKDIILNGGDQTVGGVKTFTSKITLPSGTPGIVTTTADSYLQLCAGQSNQNAQGATLSLVGSGNSNTNPGSFALKAANSTNDVILRGKPDGTLTWDGKNVLCVSDSGSNYIRFSNGTQICWGNVSVAAASTAVTFPKAFSATPEIVFGLRPASASSKLYNALSYPRSTTGFTAYANDADGHMGASISYVAIGNWS